MSRFLTPGTFALTALLAFMTSLGPMSTDMYLPSFPSIQRHFGATSGEVQLTLSIYLLGFALGQVIYGPISDRTSRKGVVLFGLVLYGAASLAASIAPSLTLLVIARFVQGLGAAAPLILARAIVRDLYEGREAGQQLARMGTIMGVVPALAPVLGAGLEIAFGWRANFILAVLLVGILATIIRYRLPETLRERLTTPFSLMQLARDYAALLKDPRFLPFGLLSALCYGGLFAFISGSSFVMQGHFGLSPLGFGLTFGLMVFGFIFGTTLAGKVVARHGSLVSIRIGTIILAMGGALMLVFSLALPKEMLGLALPMSLYGVGVGFTLPQAAAGALMPFPERAGTVSSLIGVVQMVFAALVGAVVGHFIAATPVALTLATALCGGLALFTLPFLGKPKAMS
jgi:DHA1 family bicyclomycin/chloramphenicol resistance-like MFS transporter